jgi:hypothetical protein
MKTKLMTFPSPCPAVAASIEEFHLDKRFQVYIIIFYPDL